MAFKMALGHNLTGLKEIMNVSAKVGTEDDCVNRPNDVEAVQRLINLFLPTTKIFKRFGLLRTDGTFDALTGFYLFKFQRGSILVGFKQDVVDGCVSKATGFGYGHQTEFTIVGLNHSASRADRTGYDNFMDTFAAIP